MTLPLESVRADASGDIDAHVHVWTPDVASYPLAEGYTVSQMKPASFTPEELFVHSRPNGVNRIVLIQMSFYGFDNRYMLDTMRRFPGSSPGWPSSTSTARIPEPRCAS